MNLVAKEFVASKRNNGVLILSETAGAAQELRDALLVDPKKPATVVEALQKAFSMPKRELRQRLKSMQYQLSNNTVHHWANNFIKALNQPLVGAELRRTMSLKRVRLSLLTDYRAAKDRLLLLDYDGSLVPFVEDYEAAKPSESLINLLMKLCSDPVNSLVIISGRSQANMEEWFSEFNCRAWRLYSQSRTEVMARDESFRNCLEKTCPAHFRNLCSNHSACTSRGKGPFTRLALPPIASVLLSKVSSHY
jgi:trehalose 6-phosphate synthase/phosphatase